MHATPRDARAPAHEQSDSPGGAAGDGGEPARDAAAGERERAVARHRRVGAAQMAAPSTRRWRRAGRFSRAE
jgi:hypothetical protein